MTVTWDDVHESHGYAWGSVDTGRVLVMQLKDATSWLAVEKTWDNNEMLPTDSKLYGVLCPTMKAAMQVIEGNYRNRISLPVNPRLQSPAQ